MPGEGTCEISLLARCGNPEDPLCVNRGSVKRKVVAPDYLLTLLEGLTTITHYCLLDNRKVRNTQNHPVPSILPIQVFLLPHYYDYNNHQV